MGTGECGEVKEWDRMEGHFPSPCCLGRIGDESCIESLSSAIQQAQEEGKRHW